ncbi:D-alanyl-D-alanine carboxypeptidase [Roseomonas sp. KE2513]|nr:D-alanyl-D-alanine carboxypeptidase [Roseomonas sp. KE2513]
MGGATLHLVTFCLVALCAVVGLARPAGAEPKGPSTSAAGDYRYAAFVQDAGTGEVLFAANADASRYPASLTKMMTLYLAFEALQRGTIREETRVRVSRHAASRPPSKLGLRVGSTILVREAMMALVTRSANDAAAALGEHLGGGSEAAFGRLMTRKAHILGMSRTTFRNASGLPDRAQTTTARDIATLGRRLIADFPDRYAYFSATSFDWRGEYIGSHNRLLAAYAGADGIKTGYIDASGYNLAASAVRGGRRLVAVMFGGATGAARDAHVMALLDHGFDMAPARGGTMLASRGGLRLVGIAEAASATRVLRPPVPIVTRPTVSRRVASRSVILGRPVPRSAAPRSAVVRPLAGRSARLRPARAAVSRPVRRTMARARHDAARRAAVRPQDAAQVPRANALPVRREPIARRR